MKLKYYRPKGVQNYITNALVNNSMKRVILFLTLCYGYAGAQNPLKMSSERIRSLNHLSYQVITDNLIFENLTTDTLMNFETIALNDKFTGSLFRMEDKQTTYLYGGDQLITLFAKDSTYSVEKPRQNQYFRSLTGYWAGQFERFQSRPDRLKSLADTLVNGKNCFYLRYYQKKDSLVGDYLTHHIHDIFLDQVSLLPVLIISDLKLMYNDLPSRVSSSYSFQQYALNPEGFPDLNSPRIPEYYQDIKTKPLAEKAALLPLESGSQAPDFALSDIHGEEIRLSNYRNEVVLLNFTSVLCPHAYSSLSALKRIHEKFGNKNLKIISVYDTRSSPKDKVLPMIKTFKLDFLKVILNGTVLADQYHSEAFPDFYLIDKKGKISYYWSGYSQRMEEQLIENIEQLIGTR